MNWAEPIVGAAFGVALMTLATGCVESCQRDPVRRCAEYADGLHLEHEYNREVDECFVKCTDGRWEMLSRENCQPRSVEK